MEEERFKCIPKMLSLDIFGRSPSLQLRDGKTAYFSCTGLICTLLLFVICILFLMEKIYVLESSDGTLWSTYTLLDTDNGQSTSFGRKEGLALAFAVSNHPNSAAIREVSYDEEIVRFKVYFIREGYQGQEPGRIPVTIH